MGCEGAGNRVRDSLVLTLPTVSVSVERVQSSECLHRVASQPRELLDRFADGQHGGHGVAVGYSEQRFHFSLLGDDEGRQRAAKSLVPRRDQDVPDERIDRCAGYDGYAGQVLVHGSDHGQIDRD